MTGKALFLTASAVESVISAAAGAASTVSEAVSGAASTVSETVSGAASTVSEVASDAVPTADAGSSSLPGWLPIAIAAVVIVAILIVAVVVLKSRGQAVQGPKTSEGCALLTCSGGTLQAPVSGSVISRERIPDETFSSGSLGEGVGILPTAEVVTAPCAGTVTYVEKTAHALKMKTDTKMEIFIQVGIDTLDMRGDGFECFVEKGARVEAGQPLIAFSRAKIEKAGHSDCVVVLLINSSDFTNIQFGA